MTKEQLAALAGMQAAPVQGPGRMYFPIPNPGMKQQIGALPPYSFSDRATGIAYEPVPSLPEFVPRAPQENIAPRPLSDFFKFTPKVQNTIGNTPLRMNDYIFDKEGKTNLTRGLYNPGPKNEYIALRPFSNHAEKLDALVHEGQHKISSVANARPSVIYDKEMSRYLNYYTDPEEFVARKAMTGRHIRTPGALARHFNTPDPLESYDIMKVGYNPDYSQYNAIGALKNTPEGIRPQRSTMFDLQTKPPKIRVKGIPEAAYGRKVQVPKSSIMSRLSPMLKNSAMAIPALQGLGAALQFKSTIESVKRAKNVGASTFGALLAPIIMTPMIERLPNGKLYNYHTGEVQDDII